MLKWIGFVLGSLTVLWLLMQKESISWGFLTAGASLALALFTILNPIKTEKPTAGTEKNDDNLVWQMKLEEAQNRASQTIDGLNREVQKLQQKTIRSEERCLSYQKLVDVHQNEIEKLRQENQTIADQLIQKERKLNQLQLARLEPDLFDSQLRQTESVNRELKKQLREKQELLKKKEFTEELESRDLLG